MEEAVTWCTSLQVQNIPSRRTSTTEDINFSFVHCTHTQHTWSAIYSSFIVAQTFLPLARLNHTLPDDKRQLLANPIITIYTVVPIGEPTQTEVSKFPFPPS